ncbi:MAG: hypothetical protein JWR44_1760 [Hymenobacter sp.]|jgi:hypothetical protein|nr:hypothetical protein [Hymenobacter sp.]
MGPALAQGPILLRGLVLDAETRQPIPNAQVGVACNRIGTSTNDDGRFVLSIPPQYQREMLEVALLGYRKHRQALPPLPAPELQIALRINPAPLGEVQVSGSVLALVREAVARIPQNYPTRPTRLEGFFRESDNELDNGPYRYLGEAVLTVLKAPYTQPRDHGEIVIRQLRKVDLQRKTTGPAHGWYAGPFIPHWLDFVHNRLDFINEADFKDYDYRLTELTTYNDRPVYVIDFGPKANNTRANFQGQLFIDQQSYAFLAAEWQYTPVGRRRHYLNFDADDSAFRVDYQPYAGRWHLKNGWHSVRGKWRLGGARLRHLSEFLTTAIDTAQRPAPAYTERAQYRDVFRDNPVPYDSTFWRHYTTLLPPEQLRHALRAQDRQQQAEVLFAPKPVVPVPPAQRALQALLSRLRFGQVAALLPVQATAATVHLSFAPPGSAFQVQAQRATPSRQGVVTNGLFKSSLQLDITKHLAAYYFVRSLWGDYRGYGFETGLTYEHNLNPRHRPVFARAGVGYFSQRVGYDFGTFDNADRGLRVAGTKLGADEISVAVQEFTDGWQPRLGLGVELSHRLELVADASLLLPWHTRSELHLAEKSGFYFTRSEADLALPAAGATVLVNDVPGAAPWSLGRAMVSVALLYRLR